MPEPKTPWIPPQEDLELYQQSLWKQITTRRCISLKDAQEYTFAALKQPGQPWAGNSYGPRITKTLFEHLPQEERGKLLAHFGMELPKESKSQINTFGFALSKDAARRAEFITYIAEGHSRPEIAVKFGIEPEIVLSVISQAIEAEGAAMGRSGLGVSLSPLNARISKVADLKPEWESLTAILVKRQNPSHAAAYSSSVRVRGWPEVVGDDEREIYRTLLGRKIGQDNPIDPNSVPIATSLDGRSAADIAPHSHGGAQHSARIASEQIPGGHVTRR